MQEACGYGSTERQDWTDGYGECVKGLSAGRLCGNCAKTGSAGGRGAGIWKNFRAAAELNRQQQKGRMKKWYLAAFCGKPPALEGQFVDYLEKDGRSNMSRVVSPGTEGSRRAALNYKILTWKDPEGLAEIELLTGRHHQIRVQMAYHGMPLLGDGKYNSQAGNAGEKGNLGLCACRLEFDHPKTGRRMHFSVKPEGKCFRDFEKLSAYKNVRNGYYGRTESMERR